MPLQRERSQLSSPRTWQERQEARRVQQEHVEKGIARRRASRDPSAHSEATQSYVHVSRPETPTQSPSAPRLPQAEGTAASPVSASTNVRGRTFAGATFIDFAAEEKKLSKLPRTPEQQVSTAAPSSPAQSTSSSRQEPKDCAVVENFRAFLLGRKAIEPQPQQQGLRDISNNKSESVKQTPAESSTYAQQSKQPAPASAQSNPFAVLASQKPAGNAMTSQHSKEPALAPVQSAEQTKADNRAFDDLRQRLQQLTTREKPTPSTARVTQQPLSSQTMGPAKQQQGGVPAAVSSTTRPQGFGSTAPAQPRKDDGPRPVTGRETPKPAAGGPSKPRSDAPVPGPAPSGWATTHTLSSSAESPKPTGHLGMTEEEHRKLEEKGLYFKFWGKPAPRTGREAARIRRVILKNVPLAASMIDIAGIVWGGPLESLHYTLGENTAFALFLHARDCRDYYESTANGIPYPGQQLRIVTVELGNEIDPISSQVRDAMTRGCTRCIRVIGLNNDWSVGWIRRYAEGTLSGSNVRKLENMTLKVNERGHRQADLRFCSIMDAVKFKATATRDIEWEPCNIAYFTDPCQGARGVHI